MACGLRKDEFHWIWNFNTRSTKIKCIREVPKCTNCALSEILKFFRDRFIKIFLQRDDHTSYIGQKFYWDTLIGCKDIGAQSWSPVFGVSFELDFLHFASEISCCRILTKYSPISKIQVIQGFWSWENRKSLKKFN